MIIALIGYMGSGKTTIAKALAEVLSCNFIDLDDYISEKEKITIPQIFQQKGEIYFRKKETEYLDEILSTKTNIVLALGGGTPCYGNNLNVLLNNKAVTLVYLKLSVNALSQRLFLQKQHRPLISGIRTQDQLTEFVAKHLFERQAFYSKAPITINCDNKSERDIVETLILELF